MNLEYKYIFIFSSRRLQMKVRIISAAIEGEMMNHDLGD